MTMVKWCMTLALGGLLSVAVGCGDDESTTTTTTGSGGGSATSSSSGMAECSAHSDCTPTACAAGEAATTQCNMGVCETTCDAGYVECSQCTTTDECAFTDELCPPPTVDPNQNCFEGKCSQFCGPAPGDPCATEDQCPLVQCPGAAMPIAQCISGGCMTAAERCCTN